MGSFLTNACKRVTDVRSFLRDAASGNGIKYAAERGAKHILYIPYEEVDVTDENGNKSVVKQLVAISGGVHEWYTADGKYHATVCMRDVIRKSDTGETLNDGTCPFCDRVSDAWEIYNYRKDLEENNCKLGGEDRKKYLEQTFRTYADERKAKDARVYMYILVVKFRMDAAGNNVIGTDGLPEYDLKVMKLSQSRVDKIQQQINNAGAELPGAELIFEYPNVEDRRLMTGQSTIALVFPNNKTTTHYPNLVDRINADVKKFEWTGIEKSFTEWAGMTVMEAQKITGSLFDKWDQYKQDMLVNPSARYLEYVTNTPVTNPQLGADVTSAGPVIPSVAMPAGVTPSIPAVPPVPPVLDANAMFGGAPDGVQV